MMARRSILNRSFSTREKVLLLILAIVLVLGAYYFLVIKNVADTLAANQAELQQVQLDIDQQTALAAARSAMERELAESEDLPEVAVYDNIRNELNELNTLLASAATYDVTFEPPELEGTLVRRSVSVSFTVPDYLSALNMVRALENGSYRCAISDFSLDGKMLADGSVESVSATLDVTYYETTKGSANLSGLPESEEG